MLIGVNCLPNTGLTGGVALNLSKRFPVEQGNQGEPAEDGRGAHPLLAELQDESNDSKNPEK